MIVQAIPFDLFCRKVESSEGVPTSLAAFTVTARDLKPGLRTRSFKDNRNASWTSRINTMVSAASHKLP
jgi:hypothetical protein